jgi:hypothetical protein
MASLYRQEAGEEEQWGDDGREDLAGEERGVDKDRENFEPPDRAESVRAA